MAASSTGKNDGTERALALLWGEQAPGQRGPRRQLNAVRIADAAIEVADADGLDAVSMQRVAKELGYSTMSLYNHVPSKDLLLELMADTAAGHPPVLDDFDDWRPAVDHWAAELWTVFQQRPWLLRIPFDRPPLGPNQLTWLDRLLVRLQEAGLRGDESMAAGLFLISAIRGLALVDTDLERASPDGRKPTDAETAGMLARLTDPDSFPGLAAVFDASPGANGNVTDPSASPAQNQLRFGIDRFLDGVHTWVMDSDR